MEHFFRYLTYILNTQKSDHTSGSSIRFWWQQTSPRIFENRFSPKIKKLQEISPLILVIITVFAKWKLQIISNQLANVKEISFIGITRYWKLKGNWLQWKYWETLKEEH